MLGTLPPCAAALEGLPCSSAPASEKPTLPTGRNSAGLTLPRQPGTGPWAQVWAVFFGGGVAEIGGFPALKAPLESKVRPPNPRCGLFFNAKSPLLPPNKPKSPKGGPNGRPRGHAGGPKLAPKHAQNIIYLYWVPPGAVQGLSPGLFSPVLAPLLGLPPPWCLGRGGLPARTQPQSLGPRPGTEPEPKGVVTCLLLVRAMGRGGGG